MRDLFTFRSGILEIVTTNSSKCGLTSISGVFTQTKEWPSHLVETVQLSTDEQTEAPVFQPHAKKMHWCNSTPVKGLYIYYKSWWTSHFTSLSLDMAKQWSLLCSLKWDSHCFDALFLAATGDFSSASKPVPAYGSDKGDGAKKSEQETEVRGWG